MATRWLSEEEREAWRDLSLMQFQLGAVLGRELADDGLSYQDYLVLAGLSDTPDGSERLGILGRELGWEKSRMSHHVGRMAARGLVSKVRCDDDRRGWYVVLTDHGREVIERAAPGHVEAVRRYFVDLLTPEQLSIVHDVARAVLDHLPAE